ncbi:MAG: methyltransferase domain-containing protein, partial [Candidatus Hydrogenedentes bacterium]|nr:methyltransferase domain-containing protein [Candidatus Hydrogenedentota bacterium]
MNAFDLGARYYELFANAAGRVEREGPLLLRLLGNCPGTRVLDLACGTGMHALFLAERGARVHACDASGAMIAHARSVRSHANITYETRRMEVA